MYLKKGSKIAISLILSFALLLTGVGGLGFTAEAASYPVAKVIIGNRSASVESELLNNSHTCYNVDGNAYAELWDIVSALGGRLSRNEDRTILTAYFPVWSADGRKTEKIVKYNRANTKANSVGDSFLMTPKQVIYVKVGDVAKYTNLSDTVSYWYDRDNILNVVVQPAMQFSPVTVVRRQKEVTINAYFNFKGAWNDSAEDLGLPSSLSGYSYAEVVARSIQNWWSGEWASESKNGLVYDDFGQAGAVNVKTTVYTKQKTLNNYVLLPPSGDNHKFINVTIYKDNEKNQPSYVYSWWTTKWNMNISQEAHLFKYKDTNYYTYGCTAAHEFGHIIGLGDAYVYDKFKSYLMPLRITDEIPEGEMMKCTGPVTNNDIEMVLAAFVENKGQDFFTISLDNFDMRKSEQIRLK